MSDAVWKSAFVAFLFALHPVNVDSVAWIAERKNLMSTFFWLLTMLTYTYYVRKQHILRYLLTILFFIFGLLSKPMLVTLPCVLLLLDCWPLKRIRFNFSEETSSFKNTILSTFRKQKSIIYKCILEKVPFFIISLVSIYISFMSLNTIGARETTHFVPMNLRIANALVSYLKYMHKMFWPHDLTFFYPYPEFIPLWQVIGSIMLIILILLLSFKFLFRAPYFIVGWLWYLGTLVPVSGIIQGGLWPEIAERWAYVPFIGLYIIIAWGIPDIISRYRYKKTFLSATATIVLMMLIIITWRQTGYWKDDISLFSHSIKVNSKNFVGHTNLGQTYAERGEYKEAIYYFKEALKIHHNDGIVLNNLGRIYNELGQQENSAYYYFEAIRYNPRDVKANFELGRIYTDKGDLDRAIKHFSRVISLDSDSVIAHYNIGVILAKKGEVDNAIEYFSKALELNPDDAEIRCSFGIILMNQGKVNEAIKHFRYALHLDPNIGKAQEYLTRALNLTKKLDKDIEILEQRRLSEPDNPSLLQKLAVLYSYRGENEQSLNILYRLVKIQPDNPDGYYNIACIHAKEGKVDESIKWLKISIEKGFDNVELLTTDKDLKNIRNTDYFEKFIQDKALGSRYPSLPPASSDKLSP